MSWIWQDFCPTGKREDNSVKTLFLAHGCNYAGN